MCVWGGGGWRVCPGGKNVVKFIEGIMFMLQKKKNSRGDYVHLAKNMGDYVDLYKNEQGVSAGGGGGVLSIQYNTKFIYIVGKTNSITLAMNSYLPTYTHTNFQRSNEMFNWLVAVRWYLFHISMYLTWLVSEKRSKISSFLQLVKFVKFSLKKF